MIDLGLLEILLCAAVGLVGLLIGLVVGRRSSANLDTVKEFGEVGYVLVSALLSGTVDENEKRDIADVLLQICRAFRAGNCDQVDTILSIERSILK